MSDPAVTEHRIDNGAPQALPLDSWHRAHEGVRMVEFAGYFLPLQYEGIVAEHLWTRSQVSLFDVSHMGQIIASPAGGSWQETAAALEALMPGDFAGLSPGGMRYSLLLNNKGGILDDLMITRLGDCFHIVANGAMKWFDLAHLRQFLPETVQLDHLEDHGLLALQGPRAQEALSRMGLTPKEGSKPLGKLRFMEAGTYAWRGHNLGISRSGYTGEDGFEISLPASLCAEFADALVADEVVKPAGLGARDTLRLEAGLPLYGNDIDATVDPVSAGLAFTIAKRRREEAGFPGAEHIQTLLADGPARRRVGLSLSGRMAAREGVKVFAGSQHVGAVTSGVFSPSLKHPVAMAYVQKEYGAPGSVLEVEVRGKRLEATVTPMPFVPHRYVR